MEAGRLRERIVIQRATASTDAGGRPIKTWVTVYTLPASVESVRGGELIRGRAVHQDAEMLASVRYLSAILATDRVVWNGTTYGILALGDPFGDRRTTRIECRVLKVTAE